MVCPFKHSLYLSKCSKACQIQIEMQIIHGTNPTYKYKNGNNNKRLELTYRPLFHFKCLFCSNFSSFLKYKIIILYEKIEP